jgi:hypothetical protein
MAKRLSHDETLRWIAEQRAWRPARKTKPIWARPVGADEAGREFQTADQAKERAVPDAWLCVGSAGEPWFQSKERIDAKYRAEEEVQQRFDFDESPRTYFRFSPRDEARNWAAQITAPDVEGFYIQPNYPTDGPLYAPAGGYVVKDYVDDPYAGESDDVWLVQQALFDSTYELGST